MVLDLRLSFILILPLVLQLLLLFLAASGDPYLSRRHRISLYVIAVLAFLLVLQTVVGYWLDYDGSMQSARTAVAIFGYCLRPAIIVVFFYIIGGERQINVAWILVLINAVVYLTAAFSKLAFWIDETNHFHRGPLGFTCHVISADLLIHLLIFSIRKYFRGKTKEALVPVVIVTTIILAVILDTWFDYGLYPINFLDVAVVCSCVFFYLWLHMQFVREHEQALMAEQRIRIMMSQIQPHFLYNTLSTIQALCLTDPQKASEVTEKFGRYLRQNLDSLNRTELISIRKEIEHTKIYTEIEKIRFPKIKVIYQIEDSDFCVPSLSVQPLVENAIRHGVRGLENGIVMVRTKNAGPVHEIIVTDNGRGFDVNVLDESYNGPHIGLRNVRERIEQMCSGTLKIETRINEGTTITIAVPRTDS